MLKRKSLNLVSWGKVEWEKTDEFRLKVVGIKKAVKEKYTHQLSSETNYFKKLWIHFLIEVEIRKQIQQISSDKNLHIGSLIYR